MTADEIQHTLQPGDVEVADAILALRQLVGVIALKTGETPRTLLDDEFTKAPSDEFWRATIGATLCPGKLTRSPQPPPALNRRLC